jgi:hypothetical protein
MRYRTNTAVAVLATIALTSPALAANKELYPPEMWGTWCVAKEQPKDAGSWLYWERRKDCEKFKGDGYLVLYPNGNFQTHETDCKVVGYSRRGWLNYRCWVEGDKEKRYHKWFLNEGGLLMQGGVGL